MATLTCTECGAGTGVKDTRTRDSPGKSLPSDIDRKMGSMPYVWRRRVCKDCGAVIHTVEVPFEVLERVTNQKHIDGYNRNATDGSGYTRVANGRVKREK